MFIKSQIQTYMVYIYIFNLNWFDTLWQQYRTHSVDTRWQQYNTHSVDTRWQQYSTHSVDTRWQQYSTHSVDTRWQQYSTHLHTNIQQYSTHLHTNSTAVQYTFTHKQYTEQHNCTEHTERYVKFLI
jgi:hypothetical protein